MKILIDNIEYNIVSRTAKIGDSVLYENEIYTLRQRSEHRRNLWYTNEMGKPLAYFDFKIIEKI